ncbi:MAG TPA: EamA family transporter [Hanamia sp.]|nr:EamA family transporter [Hanamia sp.]
MRRPETNLMKDLSNFDAFLHEFYRHMDVKTRNGVVQTLIAAFLWGASGTFVQFLFQHREIKVEWLITMRTLISGIALLALALLNKKNIFSVWRNKKDSLQLIVFSIIGMLGVQYTYFAAIKHSNAATATVLQFAGPILIAMYLAFKNKRLPNRAEFIAILLATAGTFLLVTHGRFDSLSISGAALFFGIASAITLAIYTLLPQNLLKKYDSTLVIGWGMFLGGFVFSFVKAPWQIEGYWDFQTFLCTFFIIIFGTLIAFYSYLSATKKIGGQKTSLIVSVEPLVVVLLSVIWLKTPFLIYDWIGTFCIISTVFLLTKKNKEGIM